MPRDVIRSLEDIAEFLCGKSNTMHSKRNSRTAERALGVNHFLAQHENVGMHVGKLRTGATMQVSQNPLQEMTITVSERF